MSMFDDCIPMIRHKAVIRHAFILAQNEENPVPTTKITATARYKNDNRGIEKKIREFQVNFEFGHI